MIWLTNAGIIEKGRLIEIEALYVSLFALAIIFWLSFWRQKRSHLAALVARFGLSRAWLVWQKVRCICFFSTAVVLAVVWQTSATGGRFFIRRI